MIINKQGQVVANIAQPTVVFKTKTAYETWYGNLPDPKDEVEKNFIVIKTYEVAPGGVYEVATNEDREALTADQKVNEMLYLVVEDNSGWRWNMPETAGGEGSWTKLFGNAVSFEYVITVADKDDLDDLTTAEKAENIVYIVKNEDAIYRCEIGGTEAAPTYTFKKIGGGIAEESITTKSVTVFEKGDLPVDDVAPGDKIYIEPYETPFTYDEPGTGKDPEYYTTINEQKIYLEKYTDPALVPGDYYYNTSGDIVYIVATDPESEEFAMSQQEFETGIFFGSIDRVMSLSEMPEVVKMWVTDTAQVLQPISVIDGAKPMFERLNGHSGKREIVVAKYNDLPNASTLTEEQRSYLFYTYIQGSSTLPTNKYWQVTAHNSGTAETPVWEYSYIPVDPNEFEEEVQTFKKFDLFPAIPAEGVIYIAKQEGSIHIANPKADFTIPSDPETNPYYLSIGTDIQSLIGRIEALEAVADDVQVFGRREDFPGEAGGAHETATPKEDTLYIAKNTGRGYYWEPMTGETPGKYVAITGDDLINMMPAMTMEDWEALAADERPDYANIIPTTDASGAIISMPLYDGFVYTFE